MQGTPVTPFKTISIHGIKVKFDAVIWSTRFSDLKAQFQSKPLIVMKSKQVMSV